MQRRKLCVVHVVEAEYNAGDHRNRAIHSLNYVRVSIRLHQNFNIVLSDEILVTCPQLEQLLVNFILFHDRDTINDGDFEWTTLKIEAWRIVFKSLSARISHLRKKER